MSSIEELLTTIARGKSIIDNFGPSSLFVPPTPHSQTSLLNASTIILDPLNKLLAKQVELPVFYGFDALGWLARANQYFEIHQTQPDMKVPLAPFCMEGGAPHRLPYVRLWTLAINWEQLSAELIVHYSSDSLINPTESLAVAKQMGSMDEFINVFVAAATQALSLPEPQYLGYFLNGLQETICIRLRHYQTVNLHHTAIGKRD